MVEDALRYVSLSCGVVVSLRSDAPPTDGSTPIEIRGRLSLRGGRLEERARERAEGTREGSNELVAREGRCRRLHAASSWQVMQIRWDVVRGRDSSGLGSQRQIITYNETERTEGRASPNIVSYNLSRRDTSNRQEDVRQSIALDSTADPLRCDARRAAGVHRTQAPAVEGGWMARWTMPVLPPTPFPVLRPRYGIAK